MERKLENLRHSLAHLLASAVLKIDPKAKLGIGPTTEDGFYYDFLFSIKIDETILSKLEEIMKDLIKKNLKFVGKKVSFQEAKKIFKDQPFKLELLEDLKKYGTTDFNEIQLIKAKKKKAKKISHRSSPTSFFIIPQLFKNRYSLPGLKLNNSFFKFWSSTFNFCQTSDSFLIIHCSYFNNFNIKNFLNSTFYLFFINFWLN
jgi:hypothetical protein